MFGIRTTKAHELELGLRAVAVFEIIKGGLVILAGLGVLALIHHDVQAIAEEFVRHIHLNPARHYPRIFIEAAGRLTDIRLMFMALTAFGYSTIRFVEGYGLWHKRAWAEWFAIISGCLYLPVEAYHLIHKPTPIKALVLLTNLLMVGYMVYVRYYSTKHPEAYLWEGKSNLVTAPPLL
jgi:uncharacterized membrane protein (DUF2068 family)